MSNKIVETFYERFEAKEGVAPKSLSAADNAAAFKLAKTYGTDEGSRIVRRAFEDSSVVALRARMFRCPL